MSDSSAPSDDRDNRPTVLVRARQALLDALDALHEHRDSVVVVGAQAIYLHTGAAATPVAEATKDSDLAFDVRHLADQPLIDAAMRAADFELDTTKNQPGAWLSPDGIPVDLMVPKRWREAQARAPRNTHRTTSGHSATPLDSKQRSSTTRRWRSAR